MHFKCVFLIPALVSGQIASAGVDSCTGGDMVDWSRRTMFGHFWSADCPSQAKMLTVFMGQRKCKKSYTNWHKLRGSTWCEYGDDGELDYRGLGAANCAFELKRRGIEGLSDPELHVFCKIYLKLKCAKMLH